MENDFLTLIRTRRSIRAYKPDTVPADVLARVLEAGTYAPSAMGKQSATIVAVETKAYRDRLTKLNAAVIGKDVDPYYGAPVIVVVLGDGESANYLADGSCVLENLMLAAHAEGLGTVWVNREREIFDSPDGKALLRDWGLPETLRGVGAVALGYAAGPAPEAAPRKENYIVHVYSKRKPEKKPLKPPALQQNDGAAGELEGAKARLESDQTLVRKVRAGLSRQAENPPAGTSGGRAAM